MKKLFGTDGIRGVAGIDLTTDLAYAVGRAAAILAAGDTEPTKLVIGRDTRLSGAALEKAVIAGVVSTGADVVKLGIIPTPAVAYLTRAFSADGGIVISASHNPVEDNGIKLFDRAGFKLSPEEEAALESLAVSECVFEGSGPDGCVSDASLAGRERYIDYIVDCLPVRPEGVNVVLDCCNGAAYQVAGEAFKRAGTTVAEINNADRGDLINVDCGSTNPARVAVEVARRPGFFGLAFDGDADRVIAVDESGAVCDGDFILAIIASYMKEQGVLTDESLVSTVMANFGFKTAMAERGVKIIESDVGDRHVLAAMRQAGLNFGGEQSGHIIFLDHTTTGDGILTGLMLASIMAATGQPLSELRKVMLKMPQVLINIPVGAKDRLPGAVRLWEQTKAKEETLDGRGRILIRASGTEPLVRVMVEAPAQDEADSIANELAGIVKEELG